MRVRGAVRPVFGVVCCTFLMLGTADTATAQLSPDACKTDMHQQFDFWLGDWTVYNPDDEAVGTNSITRIADGCGLLEQWQARGGPPGTSINFYDPAAESWNQVWVGGGGVLLRLEGGLNGDGEMVMTGRTRETSRGAVRDRITWTPRPDGSVVQIWHITTDDGDSWTQVFEGIYRPAEGVMGR